MTKTQHGSGQMVRGKYWRESDARVLLEAWRASGESLAGFARRHGVKPQRLARWKKRLEWSSAPVLHPVRLVESGAGMSDGCIEVLMSGMRVRLARGFATEDLRRVLSVLAESVPC